MFAVDLEYRMYPSYTLPPVQVDRTHNADPPYPWLSAADQVRLSLAKNVVKLHDFRKMRLITHVFSNLQLSTSQIVRTQL